MTVKLRKINQQERDEIFKDYYERKKENSPSPSKVGLSSTQKFNKKQSFLGKTEDTRASMREGSQLESTLATNLR